MGHRALIGGTSYEITGGMDLVGGTAYARKAGKCLVGGTAYDIPFVKYVTITITGSGSSRAGVTIDGVTYTSAAVIEVERGTEVVCSAKVYATITYNGYGPVPPGNNISYTFTAERDVSIGLTYTPSSEKATISITT